MKRETSQLPERKASGEERSILKAFQILETEVFQLLEKEVF